MGKALISLVLLCACAASWAQSAAPAGGPPPAGSTLPAGPERFSFSYSKGDKYRVISQVDEDVYINRRYSYSSEFLNRISFDIADAAPDGAWSLLKGTFESSEREKGAAAYLISESYDSEYRIDRQGRYDIDPKYYMPTVRNVPVFPERPLSPGDTWKAPGEERHDLRRLFGIPDPYAIPFEAEYRYVGPVEKEGKDLRLFTLSYAIFSRPAPPRVYDSIYPVGIAGYSDQKLYWDPALGQPVAYEERFGLAFDWSDGSAVEYRGRAASSVVEAIRMDRDAIQSEVEKAVAGIPDVTVRKTDEGVTISIENIQFEADSAVLGPSELPKLARIAEILSRYPERDILVAGHSAQAGWAEGRKKLSEDRARTVVERLIALGARSPDGIRAVGYGDERPVADNSTEAGRSRNRRVEITLLEN